MALHTLALHRIQNKNNQYGRKTCAVGTCGCKTDVLQPGRRRVKWFVRGFTLVGGELLPASLHPSVLAIQRWQLSKHTSCSTLSADMVSEDSPCLLAALTCISLEVRSLKIITYWWKGSLFIHFYFNFLVRHLLKLLPKTWACATGKSHSSRNVIMVTFDFEANHLV